jgi:hypothetical protein
LHQEKEREDDQKKHDTGQQKKNWKKRGGRGNISNHGPKIDTEESSDEGHICKPAQRGLFFGSYTVFTIVFGLPTFLAGVPLKRLK